jgi:hypothetical protein
MPAMTLHLPPGAALLLLALGAAAAPQPDWSLFPEGTTTFKRTYSSNKRPSRKSMVWAVTRHGESVEVEILSRETGRSARPDDLRRFSAKSLAAAASAVEGTGSLSLVCQKTKVAIPQVDVTRYCEERASKKKKPAPKRVDALACDLVVDGSDEKAGLVFVPGRAVEEETRHNDCDDGTTLTFDADADAEPGGPAPPSAAPRLGDPLPRIDSLEEKCRAPVEQFRKVRASATGRCSQESDCGCFNSLSFDQVLFVTDAEAAKRLAALTGAYVAAGCPSIHVDSKLLPACEPRCVAGRCEKAPSR